MWGIVPAAGKATRIQPLGFSKELLPLGSETVNGVKRPRAVSEYLLDRMVQAGVDHICMVISPDKPDIMRYYGAKYKSADICYVIQPEPLGLCDAIFRAIPFVELDQHVLVGLPDSLWFPEDSFKLLPLNRCFSFILFQVEHPEHFDAVLTEDQQVTEIEAKVHQPQTNWIWGAFQMWGTTFHKIHHLWKLNDSKEDSWGVLVNRLIQEGWSVSAFKVGKSYYDVGTVDGYQEAMKAVEEREHVSC